MRDIEYFIGFPAPDGAFFLFSAGIIFRVSVVKARPGAAKENIQSTGFAEILKHFANPRDMYLPLEPSQCGPA